MWFDIFHDHCYTKRHHNAACSMRYKTSLGGASCHSTCCDIDSFIRYWFRCSIRADVISKYWNLSIHNLMNWFLAEGFHFCLHSAPSAVDKGETGRGRRGKGKSKRLKVGIAIEKHDHSEKHEKAQRPVQFCVSAQSNYITQRTHTHTHTHRKMAFAAEEYQMICESHLNHEERWGWWMEIFSAGEWCLSLRKWTSMTWPHSSCCNVNSNKSDFLLNIEEKWLENILSGE